MCAMKRQPRRRLATASSRRRASRANQFRVNACFLPPFEKRQRKLARCSNGVPRVRQIAKLALVLFGKIRSDARREPAFPALFLAWKLHIRAAPRNSTRADAREHSAVPDGTNTEVYPPHPTAPPFYLPRGDAATRPAKRVGIYASQLHMAPSQA